MQTNIATMQVITVRMPLPRSLIYLLLPILFNKKFRPVYQ